jgi:hypothetical protein
MTILFPCDPLSPRQVESDFAPEFEAAQKAGFETALLDFDALTREGNLRRALRFVSSDSASLIYRGWMLKAVDYESLYSTLREQDQELINSPLHYKTCHEIPEWLSLFEGLTPQTRWLESEAMNDDAICVLLREFQSGPLIVKDFVKSRKHDWHEACFIPDAAQETAALRVIQRFIELQGETLNGSLVLRRFVPLEIIGEHPRSKMPLGREWRIFVAGAEVFSIPYWGQVENEAPDLAPFQSAMAQIPSNFWTMDLARTQKGDWVVLELGDGQVSGLPDGTNAQQFYKWLYSTTKK